MSDLRYAGSDVQARINKQTKTQKLFYSHKIKTESKETRTNKHKTTTNKTNENFTHELTVTNKQIIIIIMMSSEIIVETSTTKEIDNLPNDVHKKEQLALLPEKYLSDDPRRPLFLQPNFKYALKPLFYSALFILIIEGLERFTYYSIVNSETAFLTGVYNPSWSPDFTNVQAASYTSASTALAYTAPFIGGIVADSFLGDFWTITFGVSAFYIPGMILIALTTFPGLLGSTFNTKALTAGLLALMPLGTGFIKSVVNVFGAKQFHPLLQSSQLSSYYVNFYMTINVGAVLGGILIPIVAQKNLSVAYIIPVITLFIGLVIFVMGKNRYVHRPPEKETMVSTLKLFGKSMFQCNSFEQSKQSNGGSFDDSFVDGVKRLLCVIPVSLLVLPFTIAYYQMSTVFVIQGEAMKQMGLLDASLMMNFDPLFVLVAGFLIGTYLYPALSKRGIAIPLTYKFAIGSLFSTMAIGSSLLVDHFIRVRFQEDDGAQVPIIWQIFNFGFIGFGEIFCIASCLELAFAIAPKEQKGLASAINQFIALGLPGFICVALNNAFNSWFPLPPTDDTAVSRTEQYVNSEMNKFLYVILGITVFGIVINVLPPIKNSTEYLHKVSLQANAAKQVSDSDNETENKPVTDEPSSSTEDDNNTDEDGNELSVVVVEEDNNTDDVSSSRPAYWGEICVQ